MRSYYYPDCDREIVDRDDQGWLQEEWKLSRDWTEDDVAFRVTVLVEVHWDRGDILGEPRVIDHDITTEPPYRAFLIGTDEIEDLRRDAIADVIARVEAEREAAA